MGLKKGPESAFFLAFDEPKKDRAERAPALGRVAKKGVCDGDESPSFVGTEVVILIPVPPEKDDVVDAVAAADSFLISSASMPSMDLV